MTESSSSSIPPSSAPPSPSATSAATDRTSFEDVAFPASHPAAAAASSPPESTSPLPGRSPTLPSSPSFSSIPFESIAISSSPPKHVVNGTSGGSEGPLEDQRRDKRRSWAKHESKRSSLSALGAVLARESSRSPSYANGSVRNGSLELANGGASTSNGPLTATTPSALSRAVPLPVSPSLPSVSTLSAEPGRSSTNGRTPTSGVNLSVSKVARPLTGAGSHHAPTSGPSKLQEVLSKTRPQHLPPKPRVEDTAHLRTWEKMMSASVAAEKQRKKQLLQEAAAQRERAASLLPIWTTEILPSPRTAVTDSKRLRDIWWEGIPARYRGDLWERVLGNGLGLSNSHYQSCATRFQRALEKGSFPAATLQMLERDAAEAYPGLGLFRREGGAMYESLREFLGAWVVARSDEGLGYVSGVALLGATLLLNMPSAAAWKTLLNWLSTSGCLRAFYDPNNHGEREAYYRVFNTLCADALPKVYYNMMSNGVKIPETWFRTAFIEQLSFDVGCRVWDQIFLHGDSFIFRTCIAILRSLEHRLYDPDPQELRAVLAGSSIVVPPLHLTAKHLLKAEMVFDTIEVDDAGEGMSGGGGRYGIEEARLFRELEEGEWKESAFDRLVKRELDSAT